MFSIGALLVVHGSGDNSSFRNKPTTQEHPMAKPEKSSAQRTASPQRTRTTGTKARRPTRAPIKVTKESPSGRNEQFQTAGGRDLSRTVLVREIKQGHHPNHHVRVVNGVETPASNPDESQKNSLDD